MSALALTLAGCSRKAAEPNTAKVQTETPVTAELPAAPVVPVRPPALTRGDLVSAAGQAASEYAEGKAPASNDPFVGRRFAVRVPFGCNGPSPIDAAGGKRDGLASWAWAPDQKTIKLSMSPGEWAGSMMLAKADTLEKWEAVEGFWIPRPWLASGTCSTVQADPLQTGMPPTSPQTVGLAAIFEKGGSRLGRRNGRAYEFTVRPQEGEALSPPAAGFRVLLEGRIAAFPSGRAIECHAGGPDERPVCIVAVQLDRVAYEDVGGSTLSEWRPG